MFDTIIKKELPHYPQNITVNEHKAPTDDSIKLLEVMQEKTYKSIISQFSVETNILSGLVTCFNKDFVHGLGYRVLWQFKLNDERFEFDEDFKLSEINLSNPIDIIHKLYEKASKVIVEKMIKKTLKGDGFKQIFCSY